jgi:hypothetical protein
MNLQRSAEAGAAQARGSIVAPQKQNAVVLRCAQDDKRMKRFAPDDKRMKRFAQDDTWLKRYS